MRDGAQAPSHDAGDLRSGHDRRRPGHRAPREGRATRRSDGELELVGIARTRPAATREHDRHARAARLLVLADHEPPGLGRGLPVDLPAGVARRVLADGVERHVGVDETPRRAAFEVADHTGAGGRQGRRARVDIQLVDVVERVLAAKQADRVAAHRGRRTHGDDPAAEGRDVERLRDRM